MTPSSDSLPHVLLVEGPDDKHVVRHVCQRSDAMPEFDILDKDGADNLLDSIEWEVKVPDRTTVGILVDANDDPEARWRAVVDRLVELGAEIPDTIAPTGTIIEGNLREGRPRVGVWLMPDNESRGELEDFVAAMIPKNDPVWPRSTAYVAGIPEGDRKFAEGKTRRADVHAWLAVREEPRLMGAAIGTRDLDVEVPVCRTFVDWLRRLFG